MRPTLLRPQLWLAFAFVLAVGGCATPAKHPTPPAAPAVAPAQLPPQAAAPAEGRHINAAGLAIIKESEGLHLTAYQDSGLWLIGYGHADGVAAGKSITAAEAEAYLRSDLALCEQKASEAVHELISSNEFSALISLCYNIGWQPFVASTVIKKLNAGDHPGAADAFLSWTKATIGGVKTVLPRLEARRQKERELFLTPEEDHGVGAENLSK